MPCKICNVTVTEKVAAYSLNKYKEILCFEHQKQQSSPPSNKETRKPIPEEVVTNVPLSDAFLGMCLNQAWENARVFEKTYEEARTNFPQYFNDCLQWNIKLTKKK